MPAGTRRDARSAVRAAATAVLVVTALAVVPPPATAAGAASELSSLRAEAKAASASLTAGTRRLEAERAALAGTRRRAAAARRAAEQAEREVAGTRARLAVVVAAAYRQPAPDDVVLAFGSSGAGLRDALTARADLDHVRGKEQDLLRTATASRVRARSLVRGAAQLEQEATRRERAVARRVAALQAQASRAQQRLQRAADRLAKAQAARLAAQQRAARARRAAGAACAGGGTGGAPNGFLPAVALCPVGGGQRLRADAAAAFLRMDAERDLCITDSYRSYPEQVSVYRRKPGLAAVPGTSNHGLGIALDLGCGAERFGSDTYRWLKANAPRFGWVHPSWAEPGGSMPEPWHWEYVG